MDRPKIKLTLTPADQLIEISGWLVLFLLWGLVIYNYSSLPQIIPIHFDGSGKANGFGSKSTLFLLPIIGTFLFIGLTVLNKHPHIFNYPVAINTENALKQYINATRMLRYVKLIILVIFSAIVWMTHSTVAGKTNGLGIWFLPLTLGLLFIPLAFFIMRSVKSK